VIRSASVICSHVVVPYRASISGGRWYAESSIGRSQSISSNGSCVWRCDAAMSCSARAALFGLVLRGLTVRGIVLAMGMAGV
jgi:hypothetical protein